MWLNRGRSQLEPRQHVSDKSQCFVTVNQVNGYKCNSSIKALRKASNHASINVLTIQLCISFHRCSKWQHSNLSWNQTTIKCVLTYWHIILLTVHVTAKILLVTLTLDKAQNWFLNPHSTGSVQNQVWSLIYSGTPLGEWPRWVWGKSQVSKWGLHI